MSDDDASHEVDEVAALRARVAALEEELARERRRVEAIFARIPAIFYVKGLDNRYQLGSPFGFAMFGVAHEQAIGRTDAELFPPDLAQRFMASDRRVLEGEDVHTDSYAVPVPGAGPRHFSGVRFPIAGADGQPIAVCGFAVDVTERIEMARELERLATTDPLTGLGNRRLFDERFAAEIARAARSGEPLSLLMCDVDHFKPFNDRYGHAAGDACLVGVARALEGVVRRPADVAARHGGEEFALVLPATGQEGAVAIAERVRKAVRDLAIPHEGNPAHAGVVTLSVGVATVIGAWSAAEVFALADRALYAAKDAGRDRHLAVYDEHPPGSVGRTP